jgi:hypothetical protein
MSNQFILNSETCFVDLTGNGLDPSLFPVGSAKNLDLNYNILPFLCDLLKATTDNSVSPVLTQPPTPFDLSPFTDFSALTAVGDPRVSLGETMTETYIHFLPRVITQTEVRQSGGTQVIDNYICDSDGNPIKQAESIPVLLSLDLTGQKPYKYGSITVPPISSTYQELMKTVYPEEVSEFVSTYVLGAKENHAEYFVNFIKTYFGDWTVAELDVLELTKYIIVNLKKNNETIYLKYYYDVFNKVACLLGLEKVNHYVQYISPKSINQAAAYGSTIPDYKKLMVNQTEALKFKQLVLDDYKTTPAEQYTTLFSNYSAASAYFQKIADKYNTNTKPSSSVQVVKC